MDKHDRFTKERLITINNELIKTANSLFKIAELISDSRVFGYLSECKSFYPSVASYSATQAVGLRLKKLERMLINCMPFTTSHARINSHLAYVITVILFSHF